MSSIDTFIKLQESKLNTLIDHSNRSIQLEEARLSALIALKESKLTGEKYIHHLENILPNG